MIHALLQYAEDRGIVSKPGYTKKTVKWVLNFDKEGNKFTGIVSSDKSFLFAPDLSQGELKTLGAKMVKGTHFLIAPIGAVIGWGNDERDSEIERKRQKTFIWMLNEASAYDGVFNNLATALLNADIAHSIQQEALGKNPTVKPQDNVTVCVGGRFPVEESSWHEWWDEFRSSLRKTAERGKQMPSYGSGELIIPAKTHPHLHNLPRDAGFSMSHAPLITFDKQAFESYGLKQGENAAIDIETANAYVTAIDNLLENSLIYSWQSKKKNTNRALVAEHVKIGGAQIAYWYVGSTEMRKEIEGNDDLIALILGSADKKKVPPENPVEERVLAEARLRRTIDSIRSGERATSIGNIRFCILALSGAGARVMVRDFMEGSILQLASTTEKWFSDLALIDYSGTISGPLPSLEQILTAPLPPKKNRQYIDWVAPAGSWRQSLWRAAFTGGRLPETACARALNEHNKAIIRGELTDSKVDDKSQRLSRFRLALVKAYLIRKGVAMDSALDPEHPSAAYHCGRLLAVYDSLQRAALGDVGAGVVQRFYGGALTNPSGVFGQLSRMAQTYLGKLDGGLAYIYTERIAEIHNGIRRNGDKPAMYPSALDLDGQAFFALGFWHQTATINKERADAIAAKKAKQANNSSESNIEEENDE